jgi:hypothetical protein
MGRPARCATIGWVGSRRHASAWRSGHWYALVRSGHDPAWKRAPSATKVRVARLRCWSAVRHSRAGLHMRAPGAVRARSDPNRALCSRRPARDCDSPLSASYRLHWACINRTHIECVGGAAGQADAADEAWRSCRGGAPSARGIIESRLVADPRCSAAVGTALWCWMVLSRMPVDYR